jgi:hypothetical protein
MEIDPAMIIDKAADFFKINILELGTEHRPPILYT